MQRIANTVNQAETAFIGPDEKGIRIRWFTPGVEVDLCGHATLASAAFLSTQQPEKLGFQFESRSGCLKVSKQGDQFALDFPLILSEPFDSAFVKEVIPNASEVFKTRDDWMVVMPSQQSIEEFVPDFDWISSLGMRGLALTSQGTQTDFCCRFFAPQSGVAEDHATGSAQTYQVPFWADRLGKNRLTCVQLSPRKGVLESELVGDRVAIAGIARILVTGQIEIN